MIQSIGNTISSMAISTGSFLGGFVEFGLLLKLLFLLLDNGRYKSLKISEKLAPVIKDIKKKHPKNDDLKNEMITKVLLNNKCSIMSGIVDGLLYGAIAVLLFFVFKDPEANLYHSEAAKAIDRGFFLCPDLTKSVFNYYMLYGFTDQFLLTLILPIVAFCINIYHDSIMIKKSIVNQDTVYYVLWAISGAALLTLGEGFAVVFIVKRLGDLLHYLFTMRYVTIKKVVDANGKIFDEGKEEKDTKDKPINYNQIEKLAREAKLNQNDKPEDEVDESGSEQADEDEEDNK